MLKAIGTFVIVMVVLVLGAVLHEKDIQRNCAEIGTAGLSGWIGDFTCQPINNPKTTSSFVASGS